MDCFFLFPNKGGFEHKWHRINRSLFATQTTVNLPLGVTVIRSFRWEYTKAVLSSHGNIPQCGMHEYGFKFSLKNHKAELMWTAFFYSIRRIGMESPSGCMESVARRRHGIARQRAFAFGLITYNTLCWFHTADKLRIPSTPIGVIY